MDTNSSLILRLYSSRRRWLLEDRPWFTSSSIEFIEQLIKANDTGIEFGGGQSTFWFLRRLENVVTVEANVRWASWILMTLGDFPDLLKKHQMIFVPCDWNPDSGKLNRYWESFGKNLRESDKKRLESRYIENVGKASTVIAFDGAIRPQTMVSWFDSDFYGTQEVVIIDNTENLPTSDAIDILVNQRTNPGSDPTYLRFDFQETNPEKIPEKLVTRLTTVLVKRSRLKESNVLQSEVSNFKRDSSEARRYIEKARKANSALASN